MTKNNRKGLGIMILSLVSIMCSLRVDSVVLLVLGATMLFIGHFLLIKEE